uniref:SAP domain-containing protein n=1 Tax=Palpitomonas bilix TaxID=652834 RepID=A0A7S3DKR8_9EUKA|mmetsp:Transcript_40223/g.104171  ORF Transcript_40223/g.104171 Transcript_40223/m.104171 type:complete len:396 (+) Transcript_40223:1056-2243(+)
MAPPSVNEAAFETKVRKLRVPELKTLLKECMIPSDGRKEVLEERLLQFCTHLTDREKEGIFRLLHIEDTNINEYNPVTLPHHLGPVTLVSGGDKEEPDGHIPLGYESVRRFYIEAKDNSKNVSKTISKVFTLHYLRTHPAQSHARELQVSFVSQVSIDTPRGVRTFQSPDPNAAFYTAVKRILDESEDLSQPEKDLLLRKAYTISSRGLGRTLMGINMETRVGKRVKRATDRQHQRGCYRGTAADVACLNRFAHLSKYNSLPCIPVGHKGPPPPHQAALKPWEAPAHVAPLAPSTEEALSPVLEVFFSHVGVEGERHLALFPADRRGQGAVLDRGETQGRGQGQGKSRALGRSNKQDGPAGGEKNEKAPLTVGFLLFLLFLFFHDDDDTVFFLCF